MAVIPVSRIALEYAVCGEDRMQGVSNLIKSVSHITATMELDGSSMLNWKANPAVAIHFVIGIVEAGRKAYGDTWLSELKNKLSQME